MNTNDTIEYYSTTGPVASVSSSMVPTVGAKISIRGKTWEVVSVTYALDHADYPFRSGMRANVDLVSVRHEGAHE